MTVRVVLADDHPLILSAMENLLTAEGDFEVLASCRDGEEALEAVRRRRPDILVLDIRMPRKDGIAVLQELPGLGVSTKTVIFTGEMDNQSVLEAIELGVKGIVLKEMAPRFLPQCLRTVHAGGEWIERRSFTYAMETMLHQKEGMMEVRRVLTKREIDIVVMAARGMRNREIAEKLFISEATVKKHLYNIFAKLGMKTRLELVRYASGKGLI